MPSEPCSIAPFRATLSLPEIPVTVAARLAEAVAPSPERAPKPPTDADRMRSLRTTARAIKISLVIDATPFVGLVVPDNQGRVALPVDVAGRTVRANLAPKAVRKACKALADNPQGTIVLLLSGRLEADNTLADAGLVAQARTPKPQSEAPAEAVA